ncbi:MAG: FAD-dependent oxidoreductase [Actinobacteria bacterium]|nr:FAD-dependent oxidoreductase [Actinomycetota bacterium]
MSEGRANVVVVGGGLSGLCAAWDVQRAGAQATVLEQSPSVGGRAQSGWSESQPVDRGFQVMFRGYEELRALIRELVIPRGDIHDFDRAVSIEHGGAWRTYRASLGSARLFSARDRVALARIVVDVRRRSASEILSDRCGEVTAESYLRDECGVSSDAIDRVVRPLFGSIFLDRSLETDAGYLRFVLRAMARGPASIPTDGLGQIAEWLAAALRRDGGVIRTSARVEGFAVGASGRVESVRLAGGARAPADWVILAVGTPDARRLLEPLDAASARRLPTERASVVSASFRLRRPLYAGRTVLINGDRGARPERWVDVVCQTSNVTRPGVGEGRHILQATRTTTGSDVGGEGLVEAVAGVVARWSPSYPWARDAELIEVVEHLGAQYRPLPGVRARLPGPRTAVPNVILAGDVTTHPSLEGAVRAGRLAASVVSARIA